LIEAASGNHIWAERYDRDLEDIFDLQDEITQTIVSAIEQEIGSVERIRAVRKRPGSLEAWELLQRGLHHVYQMDRGGLQTGADLLRQCIAKDPSFAQAHSLLAFAIIHQVFLGTIDEFDQALAEATMHTNAAIKYDARDSLAHEMLARILSIQHRYDEAVAEAVRAVQFNPNSVSAHFALATIYYFANRSAEALEPIDSAMRLSPKDPRHFTHLHVKGAILGEVGRLQEGLKLLRQAVSMPHGDYRSALLLARYAAEAGLVEEAKRAAGRVLELKPDFTLNLFEKKLHANFHPDLMRPFLSHLIDVGLPK
jgi:adenylate cyclase